MVGAFLESLGIWRADDVHGLVNSVELYLACGMRSAQRLVVMSPVPDPELVDGPIPGDFELLLAQPVRVVALTLTERPQEEYVLEVRIYLRRT